MPPEKVNKVHTTTRNIILGLYSVNSKMNLLVKIAILS